MNETVEDLRSGQKWAAAVLRCMPQPVLVTDGSGVIQFINPAAERLTRFEADEVLNRRFEEVIQLVQPITEQRVTDTVSRTLQEGRIEKAELLLVLPTGKKTPVERGCVILRDEAHAFSGLLVTLEEVRPQPTPPPSAAPAPTAGVSGEEIQKLEAERQKIATDLQTAEGRAQEIQLELQRAVEAHQKETEDIRSSREWFRSLVEDAVPVTWRMEAETLRMVYISSRVEALSGYPAGEWLEENFWQQCVHADDRNAIIQKFAKIKESGRQQELEYRILAKKGEERWVRNVVGVFKNEGANLLQGSIFDITEAKLQENRMRRMQRLEAAERLAVGVAHDFNNMLGAIESCVESLWFVYESDLTGRNYLHQIKTALLRAKTLTRQLQAFSSTHVPRSAPVNLSRTMKNLESPLKVKLPEGVELTAERTSSNLWVQGDSTQLSQMFINLFLYAMDTATGGGKVSFLLSSVNLDEAEAGRLALEASGQYVRVAMEYTGRGLEEVGSDWFFEPYYVKEGGVRRKGLELAAIDGIVRKHHGRIRCEAMENGGTRFEVLFPQIQVSPEVQEKEDQEQSKQLVLESWLPPEEPLSALLVDSEDLVRQGLRRILERNGFSVLEASSGEQALNLAQTHPGKIDLFISDIAVSGMPVRELYRQVRQVQPEAAPLIVSGLVDNSAQAREEGGEEIPFLQKPFSSDELMARIAEVLPKHKQGKA